MKMGLDEKKEIRLCIVKMPANIAENDYKFERDG